MSTNIFSLFRWPWSKWTDIDTFSYADEAFLLQGRINRITGRKQFAVRGTSQFWRNATKPHMTMEQVSKIDAP